MKKIRFIAENSEGLGQWLVDEGYAEWVEEPAVDKPQYTKAEMREAIEEAVEDMDKGLIANGVIMRLFKKFNCEEEHECEPTEELVEDAHGSYHVDGKYCKHCGQLLTETRRSKQLTLEDK